MELNKYEIRVFFHGGEAVEVVEGSDKAGDRAKAIINEGFTTLADRIINVIPPHSIIRVRVAQL
jgi:hypothetical protein